MEPSKGSGVFPALGRPLGVEPLLGEHGASLSIGLHLLPGAVTGAVFFALRPLVVAAGYPPRLALVLAVPLALAPLTFCLLLYLGHRRNGRFSLDGVVLYREGIPLRQYFFWVPTIFVVSLIVFAMGGAVLDERLRAALFAWMPSLDWGLGGGYSRGALIVTFALAALFVMLLESTVEEIYFRGFLLPRMAHCSRPQTSPIGCRTYRSCSRSRSCLSGRCAGTFLLPRGCIPSSCCVSSASSRCGVAFQSPS